MASCKLGHIYVIDTILSRPRKEKFALCVCVADGLFVWVNTNPRPHNRDQMHLPAGCHELVKHDSYLDLSKLFKHPEFELEDAAECAIISDDLCARILQFIESGLDVMPPKHAEIVLNGLRVILDR